MSFYPVAVQGTLTQPHAFPEISPSAISLPPTSSIDITAEVIKALAAEESAAR